MQYFGKGKEEDEDGLTDDDKVEKIFDLIDYFLSIKESAKNKIS